MMERAHISEPLAEAVVNEAGIKEIAKNDPEATVEELTERAMRCLGTMADNWRNRIDYDQAERAVHAAIANGLSIEDLL